MAADEEDQQSTKVYYYLDDATPYKSIIPVPPDKITLGDFKKVFNRRGYEYYCTVFDSEINKMVRQKIPDDSFKLGCTKMGTVELFLKSIGTNGMGTLPRTSNKQRRDGFFDDMNYKTTALSSICDDIDVGGGQRVSMVTAIPSSVGSFLSKRAGEHLAELSASEDAYRLDENSLNYTEESSDYRQVSDKFQKQNGHRNRYRKPYVPSTICSASESSYSLPGITEVKLSLKNLPLGLSYAANDGGIFICSIQSGSAAARSQVLDVGDQIIQVDGASFEHLTNDQCINLLKKAANERRDIDLIVAKRVTDQRSETLSALCDTMPVDVSMWVETTKQPGVEPALFENHNVEKASSVAGKTDATSDEELAAYKDRRNGIGAHFVPMVMQAKQLQKEQFQRKILVDNEEDADRTVLSIHDPPASIVQFMARPNSGLLIKDRKWLKIPILMSFIGHELVNWLLEKVHGFESRKQARTFANRLLELGLIKHAVNMNRFSEKYKISAERQRLEQQSKSNGESPTEITYMSGPSSNSPRQQQRLLQQQIIPLPDDMLAKQRPIIPQPIATIPPPKVAQNGYHNFTTEMPSSLSIGWPVSPIATTATLPNGRLFVRDCESPTMTNDYASMIHVDGASTVASNVPLSQAQFLPQHHRPGTLNPNLLEYNPPKPSTSFTTVKINFCPYVRPKTPLTFSSSTKHTKYG
ncbi:hypothetical protein M3Y97_01008800 [Aphelenchoides bicaudatus]|nr:hypothetical protein M3Y97_01008800 [Aphelenchoides bicaudatus]